MKAVVKMPTLRANLSESSLDALLDQLEAYKKKLQKLSEELPSILAGEITERIDAKLDPILGSPVDKADGNVDARSDKESQPYRAKAMMTGTQAAFLEFGTGIEGMSNPHPLSAQEAWAYNTGAHIRGLPDGELGWTWYDDSGHHHDTHGIEAQRIVYDSAKEVRNDLEKIVKGELNDG